MKDLSYIYSNDNSKELLASLCIGVAFASLSYSVLIVLNMAAYALRLLALLSAILLAFLLFKHLKAKSINNGALALAIAAATTNTLVLFIFVT